MKTNLLPITVKRLRGQSLHDRLLVACDDIDLAKYCASVILKKGWHINLPSERRGKVYEQQVVYTTALVIAYGRPFTDSKGWPRLPQRLITYDHREKLLHKTILQMRHTVYAHSDSAGYKILCAGIGTATATLIRRPPMRITADDTKLFLTMADKLLSSIRARIESLLAVAEIIPLPHEADPSSVTRAKFKLRRRRQ